MLSEHVPRSRANGMYVGLILQCNDRVPLLVHCSASRDDVGEVVSVHEAHCLQLMWQPHSLPNYDQLEPIHKDKAQRKAEKARENRKKHKEYVAHLEARIQELAVQIREIQSRDVRERNMLRMEEKRSRHGTGQRDNQHKQILDRLREQSSSPDQHGNLRETIEQLRANWKQRQHQLGTHFEQISSSLIPQLHDTFIIWLLSRESEFYSNPTGLWSALVTEVCLSPEQCTELVSLSGKLSAEHVRMQELQASVQSVRSVLESNQIGLSLTVDDLADILTPLQLCRFVLWVNDNHWCSQMLNSIWSTYRPLP